jgi:uncharacterized membrane protein
MFVLAGGLAIIGKAGWVQTEAAHGMWLALIGGLAAAVLTALTGLVDWLTIEWGSARWRTATLHLSAMIVAVSLFALAAWQQYHGYQRGDVTTAGLVLTLCGVIVMTAGGWLGGKLVFVHGVRVLAADHTTKEDAEP